MNNYMKMLGFRAEDQVTGAKGVISSVCFDLYGCVQFILTPPMTAEGKAGESFWFDAKRIRITSDQPVMDAPKFADMHAGQEKGPSEKPPFPMMPKR